LAAALHNSETHAMSRAVSAVQAAVPSVDRVLNSPACAPLIAAHGRDLVVEAVRASLDSLRQELAREGENALPGTEESAILARTRAYIEALLSPSLKPVFNLTGTVLHTNLGRAPLPPEALAAVAEVAAGAANLEFELGSGKRGDRDAHAERWLTRLTGAEAATVVNNNAAAVLMVLNTLARRKEVIVSRGELIEIGGSFRLPDIMARAGCKLREVGTTNRTHLDDYRSALGPRTGLVLTAHTSNYQVQGFTARPDEAALAVLAREAGVPYVVDLGSGSLVDLSVHGLPEEPTVAATVASGADLVTFSGDKLLGGPQAGLVVGRRELVAKLKRNPMKRALRVDKMTLAALAAVLGLYADPARLAERLPTLRLLARPEAEIRALAERLLPSLAEALGDAATVEVVPCQSQIGSGAVPVDLLPSAGLALRPKGARRGGGAALRRLVEAFRVLPVPVIGRVHEGALHLDLRCLEDEAGFTDQLTRLDLG
jgi:L-seryl-tRNA(Ser) seleniumtransferase